MKNTFKTGLWALTIAASITACGGKKSPSGADSTAKSDSTTTVSRDSSTKLDTINTGDTTKKDTMLKTTKTTTVKKTTVKKN